MIDRASMRAEVRAAAAALRDDPYCYFPEWYRRTRPSDLSKRPIFLPGGGWDTAIERAARGELDLRGVMQTIPQYLVSGVMWRAVPRLRKLPWVVPAKVRGVEQLMLRGLGAGLASLRGGATPLLSVDDWIRRAKATPNSLSLLPETTDQARRFRRIARANGLDALYTSEAMRVPEFADLARGPTNDLLGDIPQRIEEYLALEDAFADEESVSVLHRTLLYRMTLQQIWLEPICQHWSRKYFPHDLWSFTPEERLIDIGAFTGDSIENFLTVTDGKFRQVISMEPDDHNFFFLQKFHSSLARKDAERVVLRNEGVWRERTRLTFHAMSGLGSSIEPESRGGTVSIDVTTLDALANEYGPPTLVKCEAEGADRDVIVGGRRTLAEHKPRLAITCYHLPDDYPTIVNLLREANPDYRLAIRHYTVDHSGTTIYAT